MRKGFWYGSGWHRQAREGDVGNRGGKNVVLRFWGHGWGVEGWRENCRLGWMKGEMGDWDGHKAKCNYVHLWGGGCWLMIDSRW